MTAKTHQTAVVLTPPEECWGPIQAIRARHDRQYRRWMPHVTLLYPFRPREQFDAVEGRLREACRSIPPFQVQLAEFRHFRHGRARSTLWLAPEPEEALVRLQTALESAVPDCNDVSRHAAGFTPHLSVGQVQTSQAPAGLQANLQAGWQPLTFAARTVSLIWRGRPPEDVFQVDRRLPLGQ